MIYISILIITIYTVLILSFVIGFNRVKDFSFNEAIPETRFSILIPFRDEANNFKQLLESLAKINYPYEKFEIIMINDDSTDDYNTPIELFNKNNQSIQLKVIDSIRKSGSPKKDAIETAIDLSQFEWILTTDADCILPENWLTNLDAFIKKSDAKMIVAPVAYTGKDKYLDYFQKLDFLSLQGCTIGSFGIEKPFMCNGANLCYNKELFNKLGGFKGNEHIAGGDDIFLMEKFLRTEPKDVQYLKSNSAIVKTQPQPNLKSLLNQRIRWAAKTSSYSNSFSKIVGLIVFTTNIYWIILLLLSIFNSVSWQHFGFFFLIKYNIDFLIIFKAATFFDQKAAFKKYIWSSMIYPFFNVYVALLSFGKGFNWKGREFKK